MKWHRSVTWALLSPLALATMSLHGEDSDAKRWYFGFRASDTNPLTDVHDLWGISVGVNLNRYLSLELADDFFETTLDNANGDAVGEYAWGTVLPQVRLRYPLFKDKLSPYLIGGVGVAFTQFNDRKPIGFHRDVQWDSETLVGTVGGGVDFFFSDNIALSLEGRYLFTEKQEYKIDGVSYETDASGLLATLGLRVFFPELHPRALVGPLDSPPARAYLGFEFGGATLLSRDVFPGVRLEDEPPSKGPFNELVGARLGVDLSRNFGLELSAESFEAVLQTPDRGSLGEYAVVPILLQARGKLPLGDGHFCPYALAGIGGAYTEFNDRKPGGENLEVDGKGFSFAGGAGLGVEYFLASNFSINAETKYVFTLGQKLTLANGPEKDGDIHALFASIGFRIYLLNFGHKGQ